MSRLPHVLTLAVASVALWASGCQEHLETSLTPAQKKKVEAHTFTAENAPKPQHPLGTVIEDQVRLVGYDIDKKKVKPGERLKVTLYVEALADKMGDNMPFVHFQGRPGDRRAWMNLDHHLVEGLLPLRNTKKGQIIKDVMDFEVKRDFPGGQATVYWGLFRGEHRLKITDAGKAKADKEGRIMVATVAIDAPPPNPLPTGRAMRLPEGEKLTIDGKLDEPGWQKAPWTKAFVAPNGSDRKSPDTKARFAWDAEFLYIGVHALDSDIHSPFKDRDSNTWESEVVEVFIDADGDKKDYLELQVTPNNVVFDAKFEKYRSDLAKARAWDLEGWQHAVHVDGTANERGDTDRSWTVEMAIPIAQVPGAKTPPAGGQTWRVNLFRFDQPEKKMIAAAWSPPIRPDFHTLERFGKLQLVDPSARVRALKGALPTKQPLKIDTTKLKLPKTLKVPVKPTPGEKGAPSGTRGGE